MQTITRHDSPVNSFTSALHAANARLLEMRAAHGETGDGIGRLRLHVEQSDNDTSPTPPHSQTSGWLKPLCDISPSPPQPSPSPTQTILFGTLATAILRHDGGTIGRIWIILRAHHAGEQHSGMITSQTLWQCLTNAFPQYSDRHLRDLLKRGENIYWQRDAQNRLWLAGAAKLATRLGVTRLQGRRVVVPLADLTGKLSRMRLALQAVFHAGRNADSPISRATLRDLTGISERAQRQQAHEHSDLLTAKANYCLDESTEAHSHAFDHHQNSFEFVDSGIVYRAHQLPNSYTAQYLCASQGRKQKINHQLTVNRVNQRACGTDYQQIDQFFYRNGAAAARAIKHGTGDQICYPVDNGHGKVGIWRSVRI